MRIIKNLLSMFAEVSKYVLAYLIRIINWFYITIDDFIFHISRTLSLWKIECKQIWKGGDQINGIIEKVILCAGSLVAQWKISRTGIAGLDARIKKRNTLLNKSIEKKAIIENINYFDNESFTWRNLVIWAHLQCNKSFKYNFWSINYVLI